MAYRSFRKFLDALEQANELKRVTVPVDTNLLIAEWADREMKSPGGGEALLFEQPIVEGKKSEFPLAINTMGSRHRMALALQVSNIGDIAQEIQLILKAKPPTDLREGWSLLKQGIHLLHARPKHVGKAECQEVIHDFSDSEDFSLHDLPILKCWPKDGGRFITLPNVHTRDPESGARNVVCGIPAQEISRIGEMQNNRSRSAGRRGFRPRRFCSTGRKPGRRPLRR